MTGRTHELAAVTTLTCYLVKWPLVEMSIATALVAVVVCIAGAAVPDLDQPTAKLWNKIPAGSLLGKIISPLLGNHRMISHSLAGMALFGYLANLLFGYTKQFLYVDYNIVWGAFVLGILSHLIVDSFTKDGVPWFFPIPFRIGFPPFKILRITTGKWVEKLLIFPGLLIFNSYLIYSNYEKFVDLITKYIIK